MAVLNGKVKQITAGVVACLVLAAVGYSTHRVLRLHSGLVTADPVTYLAFGKNLYEGDWFLGGRLGECLQHFAPGGELRQGPIWNTHVLPDGKAVYTVAVGYPGFHALLLHLGGVWLSLHANMGLLLLVLALLALCIWEGSGPNLRAFALGGTTAVLFIVSQPLAFVNFSFPWREPLFYACVLGAVWCMLRFARTGNLAALAGSGLLLGLACCVKEACILYAGVIGLYFLCLPRFHDRKRWPIYLGIVCLAGVIGLSPLLIQNAACTGNPFTSLQFMRAAPHYSASLTTDDAQAGLRLQNLRYVSTWYLNLYKDQPLFQWPFLLLAVIGVGAALRTPAGRLLLLLAVGHMLLYFQWARSDFRHMYFAHVGYAPALAFGCFVVIDLVTQCIPKTQRGKARFLYPVPAIVLALWPAPYATLGTEQKPRFQYAQASALVNELKEHIPEDAVVLSNRKLRDVLIAHQMGQVVRLADLRWFDPQGDHAAVLDFLLDQGASIYFLDNEDQDPIHVGRLDLRQADLRRITDSHDLRPVAELDAADYAAEFLVGDETLTLFQVEPRQPRRVARTLEVPTDGAAFLHLYPRDLADRMDVRLDQQLILPEQPGDAWYPCADRALASTAQLEIDAGGTRLPEFREARFIGWDEDIRLPCGMDMLPDDQTLFPGPPGTVLSNARSFDGSLQIRVPMRETSNRFTLVGLGLSTPGKGSNESLRVSGPDFDSVVDIEGGAAWIPIPRGGREALFAGYRQLEVTLAPPGEMRLQRVLSQTAATRVDLPGDSDAFGFLVLGALVPDKPGIGTSAWRLTRGGEVLANGDITADPRLRPNQLRQVLPEPVMTPPLAIEGAGVVDLQILPVHAELTIPERWSLCRKGVHRREWSGSEYFAWTDGHGIVSCPVEVTGKKRAYRLGLSIRSGHPQDEPRTLTVRMGDTEAAVELPAKRTEVELDLELPGPLARGLYDLHLETDAWVPADLSQTGDTRRLGMQLFRLDWYPLDPGL